MKAAEHLLQHLLGGVEFVPVFVQTQVQVSNLLSLSLHLVRQHAHLHRTRPAVSTFVGGIGAYLSRERRVPEGSETLYRSPAETASPDRGPLQPETCARWSGGRED